MSGRADVFGRTDKGLVRERNDDQFLIADLKKSVIIHQTSLSYDDETHLMGGSQAKLFLVADGVGGSPEAERVSRLAVQSIVQYLLNNMHWLFRLDDGREDSFLEDLRAALTYTQNRIQSSSGGATSPGQLGTTITLAYVVWPELYLIHVGDSRASVFRDRQVIRLTHDQTFARNLVDAGLMNESDALKSPLRHVLSGIIGCDPDSLNPEITRFKLALHDKLLLCTDGLTSQLSEAEIADLVAVDASAEEICGMLVQAANDAGGRDNVTVVLAHFTDRQPAPLAVQHASTDTSVGHADRKGDPRTACAPA